MGRILSLNTIVASESHRPDVNAGAAQWASERIFGKPDGFRDYATVTVMRGGAVVAVIVLHNWQPEAGVIELSAAGAGYWQSRRIINDVMTLCYDTMGCQMVMMRNSARDEATVANSRRLGFEGVLLPRMRGRDHDEWLFTLTDDQWKTSRIYKPA